MRENKIVEIVGAGLAGCEAAYQLAKQKINVRLYECKRLQKNPVQKLNYFAELVCSNSLRSDSLTNGVGLLKKEMEMFDSLIIKSAYKNRVPAGGSLAVDRVGFSKDITEAIENNPYITVIDKDFDKINPDNITLIASGPLTSAKLQEEIKNVLGEKYLYFYDAAAPIITKDSIDFNKAYYKSRYDKGEGADYINCAMTKEEFEIWVNELVNAESAELHDFEKEIYFEGCMPIEVMAKRSVKSLLFGPLKPVGLAKDENSKPYAVVQLRQDNAVGNLYNIVGFQTNLKFGEQKRIIQMIPGLENAEIVRYGVIHKNNYINTPVLLNKHLQLKTRPNIFFAGQIIGVEGYVESCSMGIIAAHNIAKYLIGQPMLDMPAETMIGSLINYVLHANKDNFQPMKANFGIIMPITDKKFNSKQEKYLAYSERSLKVLKEFLQQIHYS